MAITRDRLGRFAALGGGGAKGAKKIMSERDKAAKDIKGLRSEIHGRVRETLGKGSSHERSLKKSIKQHLFNAKAKSGELSRGRFFGEG